MQPLKRKKAMKHGMTRRDCAKALLAVTAAPARAELAGDGAKLSLQNAWLRFKIARVAGRLSSLEFTDQINNSTIELPLDHFELEFVGGRTIGSAGMVLQGARQAEDAIELLYAAGALAI